MFENTQFFPKCFHYVERQVVQRQIPERNNDFTSYFCQWNLIFAFLPFKHVKNSFGRRDMLMKIILNTDAVPEEMRTKLWLIVLPFYICFGMCILESMSGEFSLEKTHHCSECV